MSLLTRASLWLFVGLLGAAERFPVEWDKLSPETLQHYLSLIRIDTSNPPGNETKAVDYVARVLKQEGIPYEILALDPQRANLVARLKGNGSKKPILIMGHTDVVGVQRDKWSVDPFAAVQKDGFVYGRGTQDDKDNLTACLMTMVLLKRQGVKLDRDVIFVAEAGEEGGIGGVGIQHLVKEHWSAIEAEYALAEGGVATPRNGVVKALEVATTEKVPRGLRLVARGTSGHGSRPLQDNAVVHLSAAVSRLGTWRTPMKLNDTTRTYFERLSTISPPEEAARYLHLADPAQTEAIQDYFAAHEPGVYSMLRTSVVPTVIKAGFRVNVIPSEAEAIIDVRALPDENMETFLAEVKKIVNDPAIEILPNPGAGRESGKPSRLDTEMFQTLERVQKQMYPQAITLPIMMTGATDMAQLRAKGVQCYGIGPTISPEDRSGGRGAHGDNERLAEKSLHDFVKFTWSVVTEMAASR